MVEFAIYLFTKHEIYSPLIRTTLYQSESWQETDGTFKWGNWGELNEGTIFSGVRVKGNQKGVMSIKGLQRRERRTPLSPEIRKENSHWTQRATLAVSQGTCGSHALAEWHSQASATRKGKHLTSLFMLYFCLLNLAPKVRRRIESRSGGANWN